MGVAYTHPSYRKMVKQWKKCRDVSDGREAVHKAGQVYLKPLTDQTNLEYSAMVQRAGFYNAFYRTISGLTGMLFRKPANITVPGDITELLKDVTMSGTPFGVFQTQCSEELLTVSRLGILVDYPTVVVDPNAPPSIAQAEKLGMRPTMQLYKTEQIINWKHVVVNNMKVLSMVVLQEKATKVKDMFEDTLIDQWRVLALDPQGWYYQQLYQRSKEYLDPQPVGAPIYPKLDGNFLNFIPFYPWTSCGPGIEPEQPELIDLCDMNLDHYRVSADYEHGCHFTGLPTAVVSGYTAATDDQGQPKEKLYIGSTAAWVFPDPQAKATFLEFTGQGLLELRTNLAGKEAKMAILGARMLAPEKKAADTATTTAIQRTGENSALARLAGTMSLCLTQALQMFVLWAAQDPSKVSYEINKDFVSLSMDTNMITAIVTAWLGEAISFETMFDALQRGDVQNIETTVAIERARIQANPPPKPVPAAPAKGPPGKDGPQPVDPKAG